MTVGVTVVNPSRIVVAAAIAVSIASLVGVLTVDVGGGADPGAPAAPSSSPVAAASLPPVAALNALPGRGAPAGAADPGSSDIGATVEPRVVRFAGTDRYDTAALVLEADAEARLGVCAAHGCDAARYGAECGRSAAYLSFGVVRGDTFADALASAAWEPTVVVRPDRVPQRTLEVLRRHTNCQPEAFVVGDEGAVSEDVTRTLIDELDAEILHRFDGSDRYETAVLQARLIHDFAYDGNPVSDLFIASGEDWPDGLALGSVIQRGGSEILVLTRRDTLPEVTAQFIRDARPQRIFLAGGPAAISDEVAATIEAIARSTDVEFRGLQRLAGVNRQETALAIADHFVATGAGGESYRPDSVTIVRPDSFADSIVAATASQMPADGREGSGPILIAESRTRLGEANAAWIRRYADSIDTIRILGDETVLADSVADEAARAAADPR